MAAQSKPQPVRLLSCASESRCRQCPPDRICAWACLQGTSIPDRTIGAVLEQNSNWALKPAPFEASDDAQILWDAFNA
jgi:hypothetical protein